MPGPRGKVKAKTKNTSGLSQVSAPDPVVGDMDDAEGWNAIVSILCDRLELPDLKTRKGLKKIHRDFDGIYRRLDKLYVRNSTNEKVVGAVVGIYSKMCADALLRDKLFKAGFLSRLLPLLDMPTCIHLALRALTNVTHHGGAEAHAEIARKTPILVDLIRKHPEDGRVAEYCITVMSHSLNAVTGNSETPPNTQLVRALNISDTLKVFLETSKRADASSSLISHTIEFFAGVTLHYYHVCETNPDVLKLLVAALRSSDLTARCSSLGGILRLHHHDAEVEKRFFDPQKVIDAARRGYPDHLAEMLTNYGFERGDIVIQLKATADYQRAFMKCAQDRDLYVLGLTLADIILRTEFSIGKGALQSENPHTGALEIMDGSQTGLPFTYWDDAPPHCANAIRAVGKGNEEDLADILDIKYHILKGHIPQAVAHAKRALKRNPDHAYFYYAISLGADPTDGLRSSKKGLRCRRTTPFVRFQLMQRAVSHAGDMGLRLLQESTVGDRKWEEGLAFLASALEDAKVYVDEAPPDSRHMRRVLYWRILLELAINGHEVSDDLHELQRAIRALKFADDFGAFVGESPTKTLLYHAQKTILSLYPESIREWGTTIARFDQVRTTEEPVVSAEKCEDDLAAWLDELHMEDGTREVLREGFHPTFTVDRLKLYRCSWCGNPSAILKKCSRCGKTIYCDASCQRLHWPAHKSRCPEVAKE